MPFRLISLPIADLQYALNCMEIDELIAFSLCSKRTKNLVKSSNRKIESICAKFDTRSSIIVQRHEDEFIFNFDNSLIELERGNEIEVWIKSEFTHSDWIAHFLNIFNDPMIHELSIAKEVSLSYLGTIKQVIPKFENLEIRHTCSDDVAKMAFLKLSPIAVDGVVVLRNIFTNENDISKFLTHNLNSVIFIDYENPFKLELSDLLLSNIDHLSIRAVNITDRELNRFVRLWMKGNHNFYRPKVIRLVLNREMDINNEEVLKGIQYEFFDDENFQYRVRRGDGKELTIRIYAYIFYFEFE
ncbi:unnamed protein product [Caenorhabditis nigoni]